MSEQQTEQEAGKTYPGNLSRWRELHERPQAEVTPDAQAIVDAIDKGFEGLALVLTQIRFDMKGRS